MCAGPSAGHETHAPAPAPEPAPAPADEPQLASAVTEWLESESGRLAQYAAAFASAGLAVMEDLTDMDDEDVADIVNSSGMKKAEGKRFAR